MTWGRDPRGDRVADACAPRASTRSSRLATWPSASRSPRPSGSAWWRCDRRGRRPRSRSRRSRSARPTRHPSRRIPSGEAAAATSKAPDPVGARTADRRLTAASIRTRPNDPGIRRGRRLSGRDYASMTMDPTIAPFPPRLIAYGVERRLPVPGPAGARRPAGGHDAPRLRRRAGRPPGPHGRRDRRDRGPLPAHERSAVGGRARRLHRRLPAARGPVRPAVGRSGADADDRRPRLRTGSTTRPGRRAAAATSPTSPARRPRRDGSPASVGCGTSPSASPVAGSWSRCRPSTPC